MGLRKAGGHKNPMSTVESALPAIRPENVLLKQLGDPTIVTASFEDEPSWHGRLTARLLDLGRDPAFGRRCRTATCARRRASSIASIPAKTILKIPSADACSSPTRASPPAAARAKLHDVAADAEHAAGHFHHLPRPDRPCRESV
jgi:hypothetical protein